MLNLFQVRAVSSLDHDGRVGSRHRRPASLARHQLRPAQQPRTLHPQNRKIRSALKGFFCVSGMLKFLRPSCFPKIKDFLLLAGGCAYVYVGCRKSLAATALVKKKFHLRPCWPPAVELNLSDKTRTGRAPQSSGRWNNCRIMRHLNAV